MAFVSKENLTRFYAKLKEKMYLKSEVNDLLDNIDITGMVKQEEGGTVEEVVTPTNADTLGGKLTANNVVFYEEEIVNEVGQVVLRNADLLDNHPASYFATSEDLNVVSEELNTAIANSGKFYGIDTDNVIASGSICPYTATQDCYVVTFTQSADKCIINLNGKGVSGVSVGTTSAMYNTFPVKKGDVLTLTGQGSNLSYYITVCGLKG